MTFLVGSLGAAAAVFPAEPGPACASDDVPLEAARLYATGRLDQAVSVLAAGVDACPAEPRLHFMLGNALFRRAEWTRAADHYRRAASLRPRHTDTHLGLGYALFHANRPADALEAWRAARELTPRDALVHLSTAIGLLSIGRIPEARRHAGHAASLDPGWRERIAIDVRWTRAMIEDLDSLLAGTSAPQVAKP